MDGSLEGTGMTMDDACMNDTCVVPDHGLLTETLFSDVSSENPAATRPDFLFF